MIDGVKINVPSINANNWLNNRYLHFYTYTSTKTGEQLKDVLFAKYKGLKFFIIKSKKHKGKYYYEVRGSLHKYFNKGKHNANDFTIENLKKVLKELHKKFDIDPKTAILRNVEFGVNILALIDAIEFLKCLVCYGNYPFSTFQINRIIIGKTIKQQRSHLKIYNKSKQLDLPIQNLIRIEIVVKKMMFLKSYKISTLSDLIDENKIKQLGTLLLSYWENVIYFDKKVNWKELTPFERKKLLYYVTPRNWEDFDKKQRYRAKKHFKELMCKYSTSTTQKDITALLIQKIEFLICPPINHVL